MPKSLSLLAVVLLAAPAPAQAPPRHQVRGPRQWPRQGARAERQRLSDLAKSLVSEQERGIALEKRALTIEAELRIARERLEAGAPGRDATERELARLREELAAARGGADKTSEILAENAELRRRIDEVAEDILRFAESESAPKPASRAAP